MPEDLSLELTFAYLLSINVQVFRGKCVFVCVCVCVCVCMAQVGLGWVQAGLGVKPGFGGLSPTSENYGKLLFTSKLSLEIFSKLTA